MVGGVFFWVFWWRIMHIWTFIQNAACISMKKTIGTKTIWFCSLCSRKWASAWGGGARGEAFSSGQCVSTKVLFASPLLTNLENRWAVHLNKNSFLPHNTGGIAIMPQFQFPFEVCSKYSWSRSYPNASSSKMSPQKWGNRLLLCFFFWEEALLFFFKSGFPLEKNTPPRIYPFQFAPNHAPDIHAIL